MKIQKYRRFREASYLGPLRSTIILPAFTLSVPTWAGASDLLAEYELGNTDYYLSLKTPINAFGENFILAIRWKTDLDVCVRFKFWDDEDGVLYYPIYDGEKIGLNAVFEVWSINSVVAPELEDDYTFYSSVLNFADEVGAGCSSCGCDDPVVDSVSLVQTAPSPLPPYAYCNPFCDGLC